MHAHHQEVLMWAILGAVVQARVVLGWCFARKRGHQGVHQGARLSIRVLTREKWEHARFLVVRCRNTLKNAENCYRVDVFYYLSTKNYR